MMQNNDEPNFLPKIFTERTASDTIAHCHFLYLPPSKHPPSDHSQILLYSPSQKAQNFHEIHMFNKGTKCTAQRETMDLFQGDVFFLVVLC